MDLSPVGTISEHSLQVQIVMVLRKAGIYVFAIPNGGKRAAITGQLLKAEGVLPGVADLFIPEYRLFLEVKTAAGRLSDVQRIFCDEICKLGYRYAVVRSLEEVYNLVEACRNDRDI